MEKISRPINILQTPVIELASDVFWEDVNDLVAEWDPRPCLVISNTYLPDSREAAQVLKMIDACKITPAQYHWLQVPAERKLSWNKLREIMKPTVVLLIGVLPARMGIHVQFRLNEPNRFNDILWLPAPDIAELETHEHIKKQLWLQGMKPIFIDKKFGDITGNYHA